MKIAIVEISKSHEECIYTQVKFLTDAGHSVDLILHHALKNQVMSYSSLCNRIKWITPVVSRIGAKLFQQWRLSKYLTQYDLVVFNTASSSKFVRNVNLLLLFSNVNVIGILHNAKKLHSSFTQKLISLKIKKYFVLSDTVSKNTREKKGIRLASFYPIFFPEFNNTVDKLEHEIWITIPGRIDWGRRDYEILITALDKAKPLNKIKFLILGKLDKNSSEGQRLWMLIKEHKLEKSIRCFEGFIPNEDYHSFLKASDYIMPLLKSDENYLKHKISGSFNLAFAYETPLLCKAYFESLGDLQENALFYSENNLTSMLKAIDKREMKVFDGYKNLKWSYTYQQKNYIEFIT